MRFSYQFFAVIVTALFVLSACKPSEPPPDLIKTQQEAINKSKAIEGQLQQQADEQKRTIDDAEK